MRHAAAIAALWAALAAPAAAQTFELTESDTWKVIGKPEPGSSAEQLAAARASLAAGEPRRARAQVSAWIKSHPNDPLLPEAYLLRGDALVTEGDYYKALFDYEFVARSFPASPTFVTVLERELHIATLYARGTKRKFLGIPMLDGGDVAEELLIRIQERLPGSRLAELAGIELADYYFARRKMDLAAEMYSIFLQNNPRSEFVSKARRRLIYAHLASFKGPMFDASGLHEARARLKELKALEPATAEEIGADALLGRIDESDARKLLVTAQWYDRVGDPVAAELYVRRLVETFPRTVAAADAMRFMEKVLPRLPPAVLAAAPDYAALRHAILGGDAAGRPGPGGIAP